MGIKLTKKSTLRRLTMAIGAAKRAGESDENIQKMCDAFALFDKYYPSAETYLKKES